jgi:phage-related holin
MEIPRHLGLPVPVKLKEVLEQLHDRAKNVTAMQLVNRS